MKIATRTFHLGVNLFAEVKLKEFKCYSQLSSGIDYFHGDAPPMDAIRAKLLNYKGGEITCEKNESDGVAKICINHPEKRNAISGKMMVDFENVVRDLQKWRTGKGVILYGGNEIFCSGGDLNYAKKENSVQSGYEIAFYMRTVLNTLSQLPLVSVAYISGIGAFGAGSEILTACDFRLCSSNEKTKIAFAHCKMGIIPVFGGTKRLIDIVGKRKALDLILSGRFLNNKESLQVGLVDQIVESFPQAYDWLLDKVKWDHSITKAAKACVVNASQTEINVIEEESRIFAPLWEGPAHKAALEAFIKHK